MHIIQKLKAGIMIIIDVAIDLVLVIIRNENTIIRLNSSAAPPIDILNQHMKMKVYQISIFADLINNL